MLESQCFFDGKPRKDQKLRLPLDVASLRSRISSQTWKMDFCAMLMADKKKLHLGKGCVWRDTPRNTSVTLRPGKARKLSSHATCLSGETRGKRDCDIARHTEISGLMRESFKNKPKKNPKLCFGCFGWITLGRKASFDEQAEWPLSWV